MIAFLQPLALLGLSAAAIPAILHLFTRRVPPTVSFPAVRYLAETERQQSRRLKLRHLVLLVLRTALIASLVLAAARPVVRVKVGGAHAPTALVLVVDNSASSGAVVGGRPVVDALGEQALAVLARVSDADRLWLMLADGLPRPLTAAAARAEVRGLTPSPRRLDLGRAIRMAAALVKSSGLLQQEIVVLSDWQRSALSGGEPVGVRVLAWTPGLVAENRGIDSAWVEPERWSPAGDVVAVLGGSGRSPAALRLALGGREVSRAVAFPGDRVVLGARGGRPGWYVARVSLDPDELRADDDWLLAVRVSEPAAAAAEPGAGRYVAQALLVLQEGGRVASGRTVVLSDRLAGVKSVVFPPADAAEVGSLNRALAARGVGWRFRERLDGEWRLNGDVGPAAGETVRQRYRLETDALGGTSSQDPHGQAVLARAGDEPWLVRIGEVLLVGSRLEENWTSLPLTASFVPLVDLMVNRLAAGEVVRVRAQPGAVVELPVGVNGVWLPEGVVPVGEDRRFGAPREPGVYFLRGAAGDTVGALEVNHDARESRLEEADRRLVLAALGPEVQFLDGNGLDRELFGGAGRAELSKALLWAALALAGLELGFASWQARRSRAAVEVA